MRPAFVVVGIVVILMGTGWALQGAYIIPATFMRGPAWIGIGGGVVAIGLGLVWLGFRANVLTRPKTS